MTDNRASHRVAKAEKPSWSRPENRRSLIFSVLLHLVMLAVLLVSWDFSESVKRVELPSNIKARVLSAAELDALRAKSEKQQQIKDKAAKDARKKAEKEAKKKQRLKDEKRRKANEKKKAEARKKEEAARKRALVKKKEQEKKQREKKQQKVREEKAAREQTERKKEQEAKAVAERDKKQRERERHLAERLAAASDQPTPLLDSPDTGSSQAEISERDRFIALIRRRVESRWHIPPKSRGLKVVLRINLLPSGERSRVQIVSSSGNKAFDTSALNAVNSVRVFPVPSDPELFDRYFRSFLQSFSPPEE